MLPSTRLGDHSLSVFSLFFFVLLSAAPDSGGTIKLVKLIILRLVYFWSVARPEWMNEPDTWAEPAHQPEQNHMFICV